MKTLMMELEDRINRVINTKAFQKTLHKRGLELFEFQVEWPQSLGHFDSLPPAFQEAILAGEKDLRRGGLINLE